MAAAAAGSVRPVGAEVVPGLVWGGRRIWLGSGVR